MLIAHTHIMYINSYDISPNLPYPFPNFPLLSNVKVSRNILRSLLSQQILILLLHYTVTYTQCDVTEWAINIINMEMMKMNSYRDKTFLFCHFFLYFEIVYQTLDNLLKVRKFWSFMSLLKLTHRPRNWKLRIDIQVYPK